MKHLKKFNEMLDPMGKWDYKDVPQEQPQENSSIDDTVNYQDYEKYSDKTFRDLLGDVEGEPKRYMVKTTKGAYIHGWGTKEVEKFMNNLVQLYKERTVDNYTIYTLYSKEPGRERGWEFGYLLTKDNRPYIVSGIPGDNYGATIFKGVFKVSGHDGSYLFNIDDPLDCESDLR